LIKDGFGTRQNFDSVILNKNRLKNDMLIQGSTKAVEQTVSSDKNIIGYISYISIKKMMLNSYRLMEL
jgi:ABC-type phosphate transport system substrate-binding protein